MIGYFSNYFIANVNALASGEGTVGASAICNGERIWVVPAGPWSGNPLNIPDIENGFEREDLNSAHTTALTEGNVADSRMLKAQVDWLATNDRAYRMRHATSIRCDYNAAARQIAHSNSNGIYYAGLIECLQNCLNSGYNGSDFPTGPTVDDGGDD